jgi:hypothetical protein
MGFIQTAHVLCHLAIQYKRNLTSRNVTKTDHEVGTGNFDIVVAHNKSQVAEAGNFESPYVQSHEASSAPLSDESEAKTCLAFHEPLGDIKKWLELKLAHGRLNGLKRPC